MGLSGPPSLTFLGFCGHFLLHGSRQLRVSRGLVSGLLGICPSSSESLLQWPLLFEATRDRLADTCIFEVLVFDGGWMRDVSSQDLLVLRVGGRII